MWYEVGLLNLEHVQFLRGSPCLDESLLSRAERAESCLGVGSRYVMGTTGSTDNTEYMVEVDYEKRLLWPVLWRTIVILPSTNELAITRDCRKHCLVNVVSAGEGIRKPK